MLFWLEASLVVYAFFQAASCLFMVTSKTRPDTSFTLMFKSAERMYLLPIIAGCPAWEQQRAHAEASKGRCSRGKESSSTDPNGCLFNFFKLVARCVVWNHANTIASTHQQTCFDISTSSTCTWGMLMRSINIFHPLVLALHATLQHLPLSRAQICFCAWPSSTCFAPTLQHRSPAPAFDAALQHLTLALAHM